MEMTDGNKLVDIQLVWTRVDESEHWYENYLMKCQMCEWRFIAESFDAIRDEVEGHLEGVHNYV